MASRVSRELSASMLVAPSSTDDTSYQYDHRGKRTGVQQENDPLQTSSYDEADRTTTLG